MNELSSNFLRENNARQIWRPMAQKHETIGNVAHALDSVRTDPSK